MMAIIRQIPSSLAWNRGGGVLAETARRAPRFLGSIRDASIYVVGRKSLEAGSSVLKLCVLVIVGAGMCLSGCQRSASTAVDGKQPTTAVGDTATASPRVEEPESQPTPPIVEPPAANLVALSTEWEAKLPARKPHDGYVTSAACLECHPSEHESWHHSYHRTMTQVVSDETAAAGFDGVPQRIFDWNFTAEKRGDAFWCQLDATDGSGASYEYQLVMSTGSHHMQKFWYHTGDSRKLGMAPLVYLIEADKWMPESSAFLSPPDHRLRLREGAWNTGCIQCHATGSHPRITSAQDMDPLVAELGISCEACHGPGEQHVQAKTAETIVNPRKLDAERSLQVCGQCHGAWIMKKNAGPGWAQTGHRYRPGQDLFQDRYYPHGAQDRHLHAKLKAVESFWPDGENRVAGREMHGLLSSPCYANDHPDQQRMTCIACHNLHSDTPDKQTWANDQLDEAMRGNEACLQCHSEYRDNIGAHTHHAEDSAGSLCYNCHMPYTSYGLLKAVRTHTIVSPSARITAETGKPNACNQCHLDQTLQWTATNLHRMYGLETPELSEDERQIAASVLWSLKGDAAQRALMAWSFGWSDARQASGEDWQVFYLVDLMFDEYDAIRYIAYRSLKQIAGFEAISYDHLRPEQERERVTAEILNAWQEKIEQRPTEPSLLYDANGDILYSTYESLRQLRDNRPIVLTE